MQLTTASRWTEEYDLKDLGLRAQRIHGCPVTALVIDGDDPADDIAQFACEDPGALLCLGRTVAAHSVRPCLEA